LKKGDENMIHSIEGKISAKTSYYIWVGSPEVEFSTECPIDQGDEVFTITIGKMKEIIRQYEEAVSKNAEEAVQ